MNAKIFLLVFFAILSSFSFSQSDTAFWFVAPEVASFAQGYNFDKPIIFRIIAQNQIADVTISQPANSGFTPQNVTVSAYSAVSIDLSNQISTIENKPANSILNYGIYIHSSTPIQVYYEVASTYCNCNSEIFVLKGKKALGTLFFTPFQNSFNNSSTYYPTPVCAFDIVASENNTSVIITPKNNIVGHTANSPFTILLNKGQTYSAAAISQSASAHLGGSKIVSDKPIAVTIKDDLISTLASPPSYDYADLAGDQIVPVNHLGTRYIIAKGLLDSSIDEKIYILATENNTLIYQNGISAPVTTINEGQTYCINMLATSTFIQTSRPAYILHLSGNGQEVGTALVPTIECSGANNISFFRTTNELLIINLIVQNGGQSSFLLNGLSGIISSSSFSSVPGTNGQWFSTQISLSLAQVASNSFTSISNSSKQFSLSLIQGGDHTGSRYAFFTNYDIPSPIISLGNDTSICFSSPITLHAGNPGSTYQWNTSATSEFIPVSNIGTYIVTVTNPQGCSNSDTINIQFATPPTVSLGNDTTICTGSQITLNAGNEGISYHWNNNATTEVIDVINSGTYSVTVTNPQGCTDSDAINVSIDMPPTVNIGNDTTICSAFQIILHANYPNADYLWSTNDTVPQITVSLPGEYSVTVSNSCGSTTDSIAVTVKPSPDRPKTGNQLRCGSGTLTLIADNGTEFHWYASEFSDSIIFIGNLFTTPFLYFTTTYWVSSYNGVCESARQQSIAIIADYPPTPSIIQIDSITLKATVVGTFYEWKRDTTILPYHSQQITADTSGNYSVRVKGIYYCYSPYSNPYYFHPSDLNDILDASDFTIYPNPVTDMIYIDLPANNSTYFCKIYNAIGEIIYEHKMNNQHDVLNLAEMVDGIYILEISTSMSMKFHRLILKANK